MQEAFLHHGERLFRFRGTPPGMQPNDQDETPTQKFRHHDGPPHGRSQKPLARQRHARNTIRTANHRHRQLLHAVRAGARPPARDRPVCQTPHRGPRLLRRRIRYHRRGRRHRHGPRGHALLAAFARNHRRQHRIHGQCPLHRRTGPDRQLRQGDPRHADGCNAAQHPHGLRLGRPDGGRSPTPRDRTGRWPASSAAPVPDAAPARECSPPIR